MVCSGQSRSSTTNGGENILCVVASRGDGVVMLSISLGSVAFLSRHVSPHGCPFLPASARWTPTSKAEKRRG